MIIELNLYFICFIQIIYGEITYKKIELRTLFEIETLLVAHSSIVILSNDLTNYSLGILEAGVWTRVIICGYLLL